MNMRTKPAATMPITLADYYALAADVDVYGDSGICRHLPYFRSIVQPGDHVVELGTGGGDQSTIAWLAARPASLNCVDVNEPANVGLVTHLARAANVEFCFHQGSTAVVGPLSSDILFVDTLHDLATVEIELKRFAPLCRRQIVFHDVVAFGRVGQFSPANTGINLAIAEFLFEHPEWRVERYSTEDNGLLTLRRVAQGASSPTDAGRVA